MEQTARLDLACAVPSANAQADLLRALSTRRAAWEDRGACRYAGRNQQCLAILPVFAHCQHVARHIASVVERGKARAANLGVSQLRALPLFQVRLQRYSVVMLVLFEKFRASSTPSKSAVSPDWMVRHARTLVPCSPHCSHSKNARMTLRDRVQRFWALFGVRKTRFQMRSCWRFHLLRYKESETLAGSSCKLKTIVRPGWPPYTAQRMR